MILNLASLKDWLAFCREHDPPMSSPDWADPEHVEEIQQAVRMLVRVLERHDDAQLLANMWLSTYGARWRLVSVVGKRTRPLTP